MSSMLKDDEVVKEIARIKKPIGRGKRKENISICEKKCNREVASDEVYVMRRAKMRNCGI